MGGNTFTAKDASGATLATTSGDGGTLNFSVPSGTNFSIEVSGSAGANMDVYSLNGEVITTGETTEIIATEP